MTDVTPTPATPSKRKRSPGFGGVTQLPSKKWRARYVDKAGNRHSKTFAAKADATAFLARVQTDMERGDRTDPRKARQTFAYWADEYREAQIDHAPKTAEAVEAILRLHVLPFFAGVTIENVDKSTVQRFVKHSYAGGAEPNTVRNRYRVVSAVLRHAVENGAIKANPAQGVKFGSKRRKRSAQVFLTAAQVEALAEAISRPSHRPDDYFPEHGLRVRFAAYTGMRAGEIVALRAGDVDLLRRTVRVVASTVVVAGRVLEDQPPKTEQSERTITIPRFLAEQLAAHLGPRAADRNALVFPGTDGGPMRHNTWYRVHFTPAVRQAGLDPAPRFHDLRHTCVALLVDKGAPVLAVKDQLGHSTVNTTMDIYGHLFPEMQTDLSDRLDATYNAAIAAPIQAAEVRQIGGFAAS